MEGAPGVPELLGGAERGEAPAGVDAVERDALEAPPRSRRAIHDAAAIGRRLELERRAALRMTRVEGAKGRAVVGERDEDREVADPIDDGALRGELVPVEGARGVGRRDADDPRL